MESEREFKHISYEGGTGRRSKEVETYNYHKAASVLAEYGFDCIRLSDDWAGADFLAHHKGTGKGTDKTLRVQLKSALVVDNKKYGDDHDLYMCFPLDGTKQKWYLIKHSRLLEIVKSHGASRLNARLWKEQGIIWTWRANKEIRKALEPYAYQALRGHAGFRECTAEDRASTRSPRRTS